MMSGNRKISAEGNSICKFEIPMDIVIEMVLRSEKVGELRELVNCTMYRV